MKKAKAKKAKKHYDKPLMLKGKINFGQLVELAMSGNPKSKRKK